MYLQCCSRDLWLLVSLCIFGPSANCITWLRPIICHPNAARGCRPGSIRYDWGHCTRLGTSRIDWSLLDATFLAFSSYFWYFQNPNFNVVWPCYEHAIGCCLLWFLLGMVSTLLSPRIAYCCRFHRLLVVLSWSSKRPSVSIPILEHFLIHLLIFRYISEFEVRKICRGKSNHQSECAELTEGLVPKKGHQPVPYWAILSDVVVWVVLLTYWSDEIGFEILGQFGPTYLNRVNDRALLLNSIFSLDIGDWYPPYWTSLCTSLFTISASQNICRLAL